MSPARSSAPAKGPAPAPAAPSSATPGMERIVAMALAVMAAVLLLVYIDLARAPAPPAAIPFDWQNPLLNDKPGDCVEVSDDMSPGPGSFLVVRAPGVVLRPFDGPAKIAGWASSSFPDPKGFLPYVVCDARPVQPPAPQKGKPGAVPAAKEDPYVFPLNGFGMPLEALCVLSDIQPTVFDWNGQRRHGYAVGLKRYGVLEGPWVVYMSKDAPVLGTVMRKYLHSAGEVHSQTFRVSSTCR